LIKKPELFKNKFILSIGQSKGDFKMDGIYVLENAVQEYAWGSTTAITDLLGQPSPSSTSQAELWMGAHPKAPSQVRLPDGPITLDRFIAADPAGVLGDTTAQRFENRLPFLFKVLAASKPLSIQAHPNLQQAREGFDRENEAGIDIKAPDRNYRDANHKPECICALTDFWALNGFRDGEDITIQLTTLCPRTLNELIARTLPVKAAPDLRGLLNTLLSLDADACQEIIDEALTNLNARPNTDAVGRWVMALQEEYPYDIGVLSPAMLNLVCLAPGQAMYLPAGQLHAYLEGVGIELMANSDNVLRGGLTPKHIDIPELMRVLNFSPTALDVLVPETVSPTEQVFRTNAYEFELSVISATPKQPHENEQRNAVQLVLCTAGRAVVTRSDDIAEMRIQKGSCLLIKAGTPAFKIVGSATFYKAAVPEKS